MSDVKKCRRSKKADGKNPHYRDWEAILRGTNPHDGTWSARLLPDALEDCIRFIRYHIVELEAEKAHVELQRDMAEAECVSLRPRSEPDLLAVLEALTEAASDCVESLADVADSPTAGADVIVTQARITLARAAIAKARGGVR